MKHILLLFAVVLFTFTAHAQQKFLFDASKAETAGNADWIIDADRWNLEYSPYAHTGGNEANAQHFPTPSQSNITSSTHEYYWKGALSSWGIELVKKGYSVETLPYNGAITYLNQGNPEDLSNYDVFVVCEPNIKFTSAEKKAILAFVKDGGGLFMISDHDNSDRNGDGYDSPSIWNDLMFNNSIKNNPFGIKFNYEFFNEYTNNILHSSNDPLINGPYGRVSRVEFYGGTSMTLFPSKNNTVKGVVFEEGSSSTGTQHVMCAYSKYGNGKIVALGDSSPADDGSGDNGDHLYDGWIEDANGNHRKLIMNGSVWLATPLTIVATNQKLPFKISAFCNNKTINLAIEDKENAGYFQIDIINLSGQVIESISRANTNLRYSIPVKKSGLYFYSIKSKSGKIVSGKIFVK
jgi:hypothetical protein